MRRPKHRNRRLDRSRLMFETLEGRRMMAFDLTVIDANTENNAVQTINQPIQLGTSALFYGFDKQNGLALWKTDGTSPGTVMLKDLELAVDSASLSMARIGNSVYFAAAANASQLGLWKTDGTEVGTSLVAILGGKTTTMVPKNMTTVGSTLYFNSDGDLWQSNGSAVGTFVASQLEPSQMIAVGSSLYFTIESFGGQVLYQKNSSTITKVFEADSIYYGLHNLTNFGSELYFSTYLIVAAGQKLIGKYTGTEFVTVDTVGKQPNQSIDLQVVGGNLFVKDGNILKKLGTNGHLTTVRDDLEDLQDLTNVSGKLFFEASTPTTGRELWKSDGTAAGTTMVRDISPGTASSELAHLTNVNGTLYFINAVQGESSLWKSNGTAIGTTRLKELDHGVGDVPFANIAGSLYFTVDADQIESVLWRSNGTGIGTNQVKQIQTLSSNVSQLTVAGEQLFFTALESDFATELWVSDGTQAGLKNLNINLQGGSEPEYLTNVNGTLYFAATTPSSGTELWKSDGTQAGTVMVSEIRRGTASSSPRQLINVNGTLYFTVESATSGRELWRMQHGTPVLVRDIRPGIASSNIENMTNVGDRLYFTADDGVNGVELWSSEGTAQKTTMVRNIAAGAASSNPQSLTAVGSTLFFQANDAINGAELWKSNGTSGGTTLVRNLAAGSAGSSPSNLTNVGGTLFFSANDGLTGTELFRSNGASLTTARVSDISSSRGSSNPSNLTNVLGSLYFSATDTSGDTELWRFANNQLTRVANINISASSNPSELRNVNGMLYFGARNGTQGNELWQFDGNAARQIIDHVPGSGNGNPGWIVPFGQKLAFASTASLYGREVFIYDPLRGSVNEDYFRVVSETVLGTSVVSVYTGSNAGNAKLAARYTPQMQLQLDGRAGNDKLDVTGTDILVDQAGIHLGSVGLQASEFETRQLIALDTASTFKFDTDSPLGDFALVTTSASNSNVLDFSASDLAVQVDLGAPFIQAVNTNLNLYLSLGSSFAQLIGGNGDDTLTGDALANTISGRGGNDLIIGSAGDDLLSGEEGNDTLRGLTGNDQLSGGPGDDKYEFGDALELESDIVNELLDAGVDRLDFQASTSSVVFNLGLATVQAVQANRSIQLSAGNVIEQVVGGQANDTLVGNDLDNMLNGKQGNDTLRGGLGNDVYTFDEATAVSELDTITELTAAGLDTLDFSAISLPLTLDLSQLSEQKVHDNRAIKLSSATTFENASGGSGDDTLAGNGLANVLLGQGGNDTLIGLGKRDFLIGGQGVDALFGGSDEDLLIPSITLHDSAMQNLNSLCQAWSSSATYAQRVISLKDGSVTGGVTLQPSVDVLDDGSLDQMSGEANFDWFFKDGTDLILDLNGEVVEDL